jgi:hypothetical protein
VAAPRLDDLTAKEGPTDTSLSAVAYASEDCRAGGGSASITLDRFMFLSRLQPAARAIGAHFVMC